MYVSPPMDIITLSEIKHTLFYIKLIFFYKCFSPNKTSLIKNNYKKIYLRTILVDCC